MPVQSQAFRGVQTNTTAGTSLSVSPTATITAGQIAVVRVASDDPVSPIADFHGTGGSTSGQTGVRDSKGNTWVKLREQQNLRTAGTANDGVIASLWASLITTPILTTDTVTIITAASTVTRVIAVDDFTTTGTATSIAVAGNNGANGVGSTAVSVTLSGLTAEERLWLGMTAIEGPNADAFTQDTNYTSTDTAGTTGGGNATTQATYIGTRLGYRTSSLASDTYAPTLGTARDSASILAAITITQTPPISLSVAATEQQSDTAAVTAEVSSGGGGTRPATMADLSTPPAVWLDFSDSAGITQSSGRVSAVANAGSAGGSAAEANTSYQPLVTASAINSLQALYFSTTRGDRLVLPWNVTDNSFTIFAAAATPSTFSNPTEQVIAGIGTVGSEFWGNLNAAMLFRGGYSAPNSFIQHVREWDRAEGISVANGNAFVAALAWDATQGTCHVDGNLPSNTVVNGTAFNTTRLSVGATLQTTPGMGWEGYIGEIVALDVTASTADRQLAEGILAWKWGSVARLPVGHPYKSAAPTVATSGGGPSSLSISATETLRDTAALTVKPVVTASVSATEQTRDTAAFTIKPPVRFSVVSTETQRDTAALTVKPVVSLSFGATDQRDTAALTTTVRVSTSLSATETLRDTASFVAKNEVRTSVSATETQTDTASVSFGAALPTRSISLSATEQQRDTASVTLKPVVTTSISATELQRDTASVGFTVRASFSVASTELQRDTASVLIGAVLPTRSLSISATDERDTAAFTAAVLSQLNFAATELTRDTASVGASVEIRLGNIASEQQRDTASFSFGAVIPPSTLSISATDERDTASVGFGVSATFTITSTEVGRDTASFFFEEYVPAVDGFFTANGVWNNFSKTVTYDTYEGSGAFQSFTDTSTYRTYEANGVFQTFTATRVIL